MVKTWIIYATCFIPEIAIKWRRAEWGEVRIVLRELRVTTWKAMRNEHD
jgi:hypothetical protein